MSEKNEKRNTVLKDIEGRPIVFNPDYTPYVGTAKEVLDAAIARGDLYYIDPNDEVYPEQSTNRQNVEGWNEEMAKKRKAYENAYNAYKRDILNKAPGNVIFGAEAPAVQSPTLPESVAYLDGTMPNKVVKPTVVPTATKEGAPAAKAETTEHAAARKPTNKAVATATEEKATDAEAPKEATSAQTPAATPTAASEKNKNELEDLQIPWPFQTNGVESSKSREVADMILRNAGRLPFGSDVQRAANSSSGSSIEPFDPNKESYHQYMVRTYQERDKREKEASKRRVTAKRAALAAAKFVRNTNSNAQKAAPVNDTTGETKAVETATPVTAEAAKVEKAAKETSTPAATVTKPTAAEQPVTETKSETTEQTPAPKEQPVENGEYIELNGKRYKKVNFDEIPNNHDAARNAGYVLFKKPDGQITWANETEDINELGAFINGAWYEVVDNPIAKAAGRTFGIPQPAATAQTPAVKKKVPVATTQTPAPAAQTAVEDVQQNEDGGKMTILWPERPEMEKGNYVEQMDAQIDQAQRYAEQQERKAKRERDMAILSDIANLVTKGAAMHGGAWKIDKEEARSAVANEKLRALRESNSKLLAEYARRRMEAADADRKDRNAAAKARYDAKVAQAKWEADEDYRNARLKEEESYHNALLGIQGAREERLKNQGGGGSGSGNKEKMIRYINGMAFDYNDDKAVVEAYWRMVEANSNLAVTEEVVTSRGNKVEKAVSNPSVNQMRGALSKGGMTNEPAKSKGAAYGNKKNNRGY